MDTELEQVKIRISEVKPLLGTLEWDLTRNQLNPGKKKFYDNLKKEYEELLVKLNSLSNSNTSNGSNISVNLSNPQNESNE